MTKQAEQLWASSKYEVMFHCQKHYNTIRQLMQSKPTYEEVAQQIEAAKQQCLFPQMLGLMKEMANEYEVMYLQQSTILNKT